MQRQGSFAEAEYAGKKKQTRRDKFLAEMEQAVPWPRLVARLAPLYPKGERGRPPIPLERMLRVYFVQQWYGLADEAVEDAFYDSQALRGFAGIALNRDPVPDATTVLHFRHWLERHDLTKGLFDEVSAMLEEHGLLMRQSLPRRRPGDDRRCHHHCRSALDQEQAEGARPGDASDKEGQSVMEWMPLLTASRCAKVVMFSHPTNGEASMDKVSIIGLDLAKRSFQALGALADGGVGFRKKLSREKVLGFFAEQPRCIVAMEACGSAHHWGRAISDLGHEVRLIPPAYVKPFVKRQKNDATDAEAIAEAASRPTMRFVAVKTEGQQARAMLFRTRDLLVRQRTQLINALRGHLSEHGVVAAQGPVNVKVLEEAV